MTTIPATSRHGRLIAFEGIDGTGKSTQISLLADWLRQHGHDVVVTREPTNGIHGQKIRRLYQARDSVSRQEELALFLADRREHVEQLIAPALVQGKVILTDRYYFSTAAYQGVHGFDPEEIIRRNEAFAPVPDLVILITIPPEEAVMRIERYRNEVLNQFEQEEGLRQVATIFAGLCCACIRRVDGSGTIAAVHAQVVAHISDSRIFG